MALKDILKQLLFGQDGKRFMTVSSTEIINNSRPVQEKYDAETQINRGYVNNADVYSIIKKIAKTAATIPIIAKDYNGNVVEVPELEILRNPNEETSESELKEIIATHLLSTGNFYILQKNNLSGNQLLELWPLPPQDVRPYVDVNTFPHRITDYELTFYNRTLLGKENVIHGKFINPIINTNADEVIGLSPLQAAAKILNRSDAETDYSNAAMNNGGVQGIVANTSLTETSVTTLAQLKQDWYNDTTGVKNAGKIRFQVGDIKYIPIGLSPVEMNVLSSEIRTLKRMCNVFGVSDALFNNNESSTYNNLEQFEKQLYTNAVMPIMHVICGALTKKWGKKNKCKFEPDVSDVMVLQKDFKLIAEQFSQMPIFNPKVMLESLGMPTNEIMPELDKFYMKNGYLAIEDFNAPEL
jgi:HK97 family phage portal protein